MRSITKQKENIGGPGRYFLNLTANGIHCWLLIAGCPEAKKKKEWERRVLLKNTKQNSK